jgi:hypothetical protein
MKKWQVAGPVARLAFACADESVLAAFNETMAKVAGVRLRTGYWAVPKNALNAIEQVRQQHPGVEVVAASWEKKPEPTPDWATLEARLRADGTVQPWVFEFLLGYQKEAIIFAANKEGCHFWHSTGAGKSCSSIVAAALTPGPVVVVTRAAARLQFAREIQRFTTSRPFVIRPASEVKARLRVQGESHKAFRSRHKGQGLSRGDLKAKWLAHWNLHGPDDPPHVDAYITEARTKGYRPFIVVGWESLAEHLDDLVALEPGCVVFDENHRGKSHSRYDRIALPPLPEDPSDAAERLRADDQEAKSKGGFVKDTPDGRFLFTPLRNAATCASLLGRSARRRIATTATPIANRIRDLWGQLDTIEPNAWGNATSWLDRYADRRPGTYGGYDTSGTSNVAELKDRLKDVAHILDYRFTHRELPPKRRQSYYVAPSDQVEESAGFAKELKDATKRGPTAVLEVKLAMAASRKRKAVLGIVEDHLGSGQKVIIFTARRRDCDELGELVRKVAKDTKATVWVGHGDLSVDARQAIVDEYMQHPGPCVFVATGQSAGESLNLQDTDALLFVQLPYTPEKLRQWEGRVARQGQKRPVTIYFVIAEGTIDEHIAQILIDKLPAVEKIANDVELGEASSVLAGSDPNRTPDEFAAAVLAMIGETSADPDLDDWD